jgi:hypothetical protein
VAFLQGDINEKIKGGERLKSTGRHIMEPDSNFFGTFPEIVEARAWND